jgi:sugar phosphate isomerase/epimerase
MENIRMDFKICLNLGTINHLDYEAQLRVSHQAGFQSVGLHMIRLEEYLYSGHTLQEAVDCLKKYQLRAAEVTFFPDWISATGKALQQTLTRAEYICSTMEWMDCPIVIANTLGEKRYDPVLAHENFAAVCEVASRYGVRMAVEFLPWTPTDTINKAWDMVKSANCANGGIVLDTFHYFKGPPSKEELYGVPIEKIFIVHLDDLEDADADLVTLTRRHRVLPGEGVFNFDEVLEYLFTRGYQGYFSLEILNRNHPARDPLELATRARLSTEKLLSGFADRFQKAEPPSLS